MAIYFYCPECRAKYEIDNEMGGRPFECQCGAKSAVPSAPERDGDYNACPECGAMVGNGGVVCVGCGFNFNTGRKLAVAEPDDDNEEADFKIKYHGLLKLAKPAALLLTIAVAALAYHVIANRKHYGIGGGNPLGTLAGVESHLKNAGFVDGSQKARELRGLLGKGAPSSSEHIFMDGKLVKESGGMGFETVTVVIGADGGVVSVIGEFSTPSDAIPGAGSRVGRFMNHYWREIGCGEPEFKSEFRGEGRLAQKLSVAKFDGDGMEAVWERIPTSIGLYDSEDKVTVKIKKP